MQNKNSGGQYIGVKKFYVHPKYNSSTFDSDIAVWKLATNVVPNKKTGFAILPTQGQEPKAGTMITVGGWYVPLFPDSTLHAQSDN